MGDTQIGIVSLTHLGIHHSLALSPSTTSNSELQSLLKAVYGISQNMAIVGLLDPVTEMALPTAMLLSHPEVFTDSYQLLLFDRGSSLHVEFSSDELADFAQANPLEFIRSHIACIN